MFKYSFLSLGLALLISPSLAMDTFEKKMQEIAKKNEDIRKEEAGKNQQMMESLNKAQSLQEKANIIASRLGVQPVNLLAGRNLLAGADKLLEKK